jgi:large subunit ribosomal protein L6
MSRVGKQAINLPEKVEVTVGKENLVTVKGPKGELSQKLNPEMKIKVDDHTVTVDRPSDSLRHRAQHGTTRALLNNMVEGVTKGFEKMLDIKGVGYRAQVKGKTLVVNAGYSQPVELDIPEGIDIECPTNTEIKVSGNDKQAVGEFAAIIRKVREPEPYLGKGIRYRNEHIRRKEGKTAK